MEVAERPQSTKWRYAAVVLLVLAALLALLNPALWIAVVIGALLGISLWLPPRLLFLTLVSVAGIGVIGFLVVASLNGGFGGGYDPNRAAPPTLRSVAVNATATYDTDAHRWRLAEQFKLSPETLARAAQLLWNDQQSGQALTELAVTEQERLVTDHLKTLGWNREASVDGELVFSASAPRTIAGDVPVYPLTTGLSLPVLEVRLTGSFSLHPDKSSNLLIRTPEGMILSTEPASDAKPVPDGEERSVPVNINGFPVTSVAIEAASPAVRHEPLRSITKLSLGAAAAWIVGGLWAGGLALFKDEAKAKVQAWTKTVAGKKSPEGQPKAGTGGPSAPNAAAQSAPNDSEMHPEKENDAE